jgi:hypothetical protein
MPWYQFIEAQFIKTPHVCHRQAQEMPKIGSIVSSTLEHKEIWIGISLQAYLASVAKLKMCITQSHSIFALSSHISYHTQKIQVMVGYHHSHKYCDTASMILLPNNFIILKTDITCDGIA